MEFDNAVLLSAMNITLGQGSPFVSPDGLTLYHHRSEAEDAQAPTYTWQRDLILGNEFGEPIELAGVNTGVARVRSGPCQATVNFCFSTWIGRPPDGGVGGELMSGLPRPIA